jgi:hypothetical protein
VGAILVDCPAAEVVDGPDHLFVRVRADPGVPVSIALWRNLRGFPSGAEYRSIGVEPMLGAVFDLADAEPGHAAMVPSSGKLGWLLDITSGRQADEPE